MAHKIVLVRHGLSAHTHSGLIDLAGFGRWRAAYEAAGIDERDEPPPALRALASSSGVIVASEARRAIESARLLDPQARVTTSPLLQELELAPPNIRGIRMPLMAWALAIGVEWILRTALRRARVSPSEVQRSREAAAWLADLADRHGSVLAVTHASFRSLLSERLIEQGWRCETTTGRSSHWSAWPFRRLGR
jgi:broad specificity phosphatase PhoE